MRSEDEIRDRLDSLDIEDQRGPDKSHAIGVRNALRWVLDDD